LFSVSIWETTTSLLVYRLSWLAENYVGRSLTVIPGKRIIPYSERSSADVEGAGAKGAEALFVIGWFR